MSSIIPESVPPEYPLLYFLLDYKQREMIKRSLIEFWLCRMPVWLSPVLLLNLVGVRIYLLRMVIGSVVFLNFLLSKLIDVNGRIKITAPLLFGVARVCSTGNETSPIEKLALCKMTVPVR